MTKQIPLTLGKVALVDDEDFERVNMHKWCATKKDNRFYAVRGSGPNLFRKTIYMHHEITGTPPVGMEVDHINGNTLDNQRLNLRICTTAENQHNRARNSNNTSGFKGVAWSLVSHKWQAKIEVNRKQIHLGFFDNPKDAARAYDDAARKHYGKFARTNF